MRLLRVHRLLWRIGVPLLWHHLLLWVVRSCWLLHYYNVLAAHAVWAPLRLYMVQFLGEQARSHAAEKETAGVSAILDVVLLHHELTISSVDAAVNRNPSDVLHGYRHAAGHHVILANGRSDLEEGGVVQG